MASLIPENAKTVLDVGCGKMWLREFLNENIAYYGMDYVKRNDDTIVCNLNNREFTDMKFDAVLCSGVIEYIHEENLSWFFEKIHETAPVLIVSYNTRDNVPSVYVRKMNFWKNHMYREEFISLVKSSGFRLDASSEKVSGNEIFRFCSLP